VIFGASGDLTKRKILPALYELWVEKLLPENFSIVGFARSGSDDSAFRKSMQDAVGEFARNPPGSPAEWEPFAQRLHYVKGGYDDPASFEQLKKVLDELDAKDKRPPRRVFYLSTPPNVYSEVIGRLGAAGLAKTTGDDSWARIIIEKPFGHDLDSAKTLDAQLHQVFDESQAYRIDHYLGKETVQNILVLRFANGIFEPIWNRSYIDHVQITAAESLGVEDRAGYYDQTGALRDMFQNHILQVLTFVAMEPPVSFEAEDVRNEKVKVLHALSPITPSQVDTRAVRGQYGKGRIGGKELPGYRDEPGVAKQSMTDTFAAVKLNVDNWRWADVPFYCRTGKRLPSRVTEIVIQFKRAPHLMFKHLTNPIKPNCLILRIQPDEGISLAFEAKLPGQALATKQVEMQFKYSTAFGVPAPEAYERLILDCMLGDATLFNRADSVEMSWQFVMPILEAWAEKPPRWFPNYSAGTWGPPEAYALIERDGRWWRKPTV
jgi:glucose-6-phosphate 1-dehydrogenase